MKSKKLWWAIHYHFSVILLSIMVVLILVIVGLINLQALMFAMLAVALTAVATATVIFTNQIKVPYPLEKHLLHVINNTLTTLSNDITEDMTQLNIARALATELVYEGLIKMEDFEEVKLAVLEVLDEHSDEGFISSRALLHTVTPHLTGSKWGVTEV